MTGPRIGELFSGYGGLGMGVRAVLGGTIAWHSEIDPGASRILAHRYPDVPNHGDITAIDWAGVEPVDVLTGGFPCQDVSSAGLRKGLRPDTRSGLWTQFAYAIDQLRPPLVVIENVRGLLSAEANCDVEPCPWCVGDGEPVLLRALGAVLGDLAQLGFDAEWQSVRASDIGASHDRFRVFVVAWPAGDATSDPRRILQREPGGAAADPDGERHERGRRSRDRRSRPADGGLAAACPPAHGRHEGRAEPAGLIGRPDAPIGGDAAAHSDDPAEHWERSRAQPRRGGETAAHAHSEGRRGVAEHHPAPQARRGAVDRDDADRLAVVARGLDWGEYAGAVHRWERIIGRPAPAPTEWGRNGQPRLAAEFVEWMQGLPAGWVTDPAIWDGMTNRKGRVLTGRALVDARRNAQLHALGNGVVPQQAAHALRLLLPDVAALVGAA